jgi:hypothetical protein
MISPEREMWQSVIIRALIDAAWTPPAYLMNGELSKNAGGIRRVRDRDRREADAWFRRAGKDFREVCSHAGFDPDAVHQAYTSGRIDVALLHAAEETKRARRAA